MMQQYLKVRIYLVYRIRNYIRFEEIGNSTEYYADGKKFRVFDVESRVCGEFKIKGKIQPNQDKKIRWSLAKDDVSPQDIFQIIEWYGCR